MKGFLFIGILIAVIIVAALTIANLKTKPLPAALATPESGLNGTLTELPNQVKTKVQEALDRAEEQRKEAEEALK